MDSQWGTNLGIVFALLPNRLGTKNVTEHHLLDKVEPMRAAAAVDRLRYSRYTICFGHYLLNVAGTFEQMVFNHMNYSNVNMKLCVHLLKCWPMPLHIVCLCVCACA